MITYKGRVVYERIQHKMTEKDAARIMASINKEKTPAELARALWGIDMQIVKMQVLDEGEVLEFLMEFLTSLIKYIGIGADWLWNFLWSLLGPPPAVETEPIPEEPEEDQEEKHAST